MGMVRGFRGAKRATAVALASLVALVLGACTPNADATARLPQQAQGAFPSAIEGRLETAVTDAMKLAGASGALVGVWAPWSGSYTDGLGTTAIKGSAPVTADMHFRIATNTTSMTCSVLLSLVDEGKVKLDDPVSLYLPRMIGVSGITLRELCQNTSGIGDYTPQLKPEFVTNPARQWPTMELLSDGLATKPAGSPGQVYYASQAGMVLLGMALQAATGMSWGDLYRHYVFDRLGMTQSSFPDSGQVSIPAPHPLGYATSLTDAGALQCGTTIDETALSPSMGWTAGGVVSTITDLKTFVQAFATGSLVSAESARAQARVVPIGNGAPSWQTYGLGMLKLGPLLGNVGEIPGFISAMFTDPVSGLTVVVALNNSSAGAGFARELAQQLASIASKAPAKAGEKAIVALPWSEAQAVAAMKAAAVCQPAAPKK
ncbi:serine hydrolase domain-containing protein [Diaminobutyricibacter sp. McL0608]|uniref:serine hydrolase domain-containing protein n=1 Tax=Leifsonia sp. McL0608 TaxID=3143537 RepID=UPI0031F2E13D